MKVTKDILESGKSKRGGWSLKQLRLFGITEFKKGWKSKLTDSNFPEETIAEFLALKDTHLKGGDTPSLFPIT